MTAVCAKRAVSAQGAFDSRKKSDWPAMVEKTRKTDHMAFKGEDCSSTSPETMRTEIVAGTRVPVSGTRQSRSAVSRAMLAAVRWYQVHISAGNPPCCKYYPSCSNYAIQAVTRYGAARGGLLAVLRLLRCRPWSNGGIDDVPQRYSIFYRFSWSKAHEEPRLTPLASDVKETA